MLRSLLAVTVFSALLLTACGGGDSGAKADGGGAAGGARAMAASMESELGTLKQCFQDEKDGKAACGTDLLTNRMTLLCSDVHTGKKNDEFGVSDFKAFEPVCASWAGLLSTPLADRPNAISAMIDKVKAIN